MSGESQPSSAATQAWLAGRDSFALAAGYLVLVGSFDYCLASAIGGRRVALGRDLEILAALVIQAAFVALLIRRAIPHIVVATAAFVGNWLLVSTVVAFYSAQFNYAAQHSTHYGYASAFLAGQLAFLALWLGLGDQPLGWRLLVTFASGGALIVGWYGYAARRITADWNLVWMSETLAVLGVAVLLRVAGFQFRQVGGSAKSLDHPRGKNGTEGEAQYRLWHLIAGLSVASCLCGLARLLGMMTPSYFADLAARGIDADDVQRGLGVGFAASLAVAFAALSLLMRTNLVARYLPPLIYAAAMGYAIHAWGPPYVDASIVKSGWSANLPGWSPSASQWSIWMLLNAGMAMSGTMFLHALGSRLTRDQTTRIATNAR